MNSVILQFDKFRSDTHQTVFGYTVNISNLYCVSLI